jgi:hypothetical protein
MKNLKTSGVVMHQHNSFAQAKLKAKIALAILAVIGFSMAACDDGSTGGGAPGTWSNVTSISQINGTWKAPSSVTYNVEGMTVIISTSNYTITFNAAANTMTVSGSNTTAYSGGNIAAEWPGIKEVLQSQYKGLSGVTVSLNDANYSFTMTYNNYSTAMPEDFTVLDFQINQNGKKLKVAAGEDLGYEIIYTKQ